jgi:uncharacterized membrane protein
MKKYFITGLLVWVPLGITLWVLNLTIGTMDRTLLLLPEHWHPDRVLGIHIPGLGIILTLAVVALTGLLMRNVFGQYLWVRWEKGMLHVPFVGSIYKGVKQVSEPCCPAAAILFAKYYWCVIPTPRLGRSHFKPVYPAKCAINLMRNTSRYLSPPRPVR